MSPPQKEESEILNIESLEPAIRTNNRTKIAERIGTVDKEKQRRITLYHFVVHILAFMIIIPYVSLVIMNQSMPDSYSTIVSVVIGFYFAKSLFNG